MIPIPSSLFRDSGKQFTVEITGPDLQQLAATAGALQQQHGDVVMEVAAAVARSHKQGVGADARVGVHHLAYRFDVGTQPVRQVGQLVHEADTGGEHDVRGVFGEFSRTNVHVYHFVTVAVERCVEPLERIGASATRRADNDPVRLHEVGHRGAFFEKLRVGNDVKR